MIDASNILPLRALYSDTNGLFIKRETRQGRMYNSCPNGHQIYHQACGGCASWGCRFRCGCFNH